MSVVFDLSSLSAVILSYFIVSMLYVTVVCMFQSDFKRLVAYSSVSHMIAVPMLIVANSSISLKSLLMVMLFHGLSSPILFMLVGVIYSLFQTRQLIAVRGLILISPLISFICILSFFFTLSAPPFPSFFFRGLIYSFNILLVFLFSL
jgi:NADH:ubiquinone oxidoreductase subunit 4 (subunit M)